MPDANLQSICYKKNHLKEVIARIDFVSPISTLSSELPKNVSQVALAHFPIQEPRKAVMQTIQLGQEKPSEREEFTQWGFFGVNREKSLTITRDAIFVSYSQYTNYEEFRKEFIEIVKVLFNTFDQSQPSRLGLRYINEIEIAEEKDCLNWKKYFSKDILGLFNYSIKEAKPTRIFHNFEVAYSDFNLRFQFGMHNPDFPAPIKRKIFILDYDASYMGLLDTSSIDTYLDKFHNSIQVVFEQNITDNFRKKMNG